MNRRWFAHGAFACLAVVIGLSLGPGVLRYAAIPVNIGLIALYNRRLHDIGQPGWWQLPFYLAGIPIGVVAAMGADVSEFSGYVLIAKLMFTTALALWPGMDKANAYGPPPGGRLAEAPEDVFS